MCCIHPVYVRKPRNRFLGKAVVTGEAPGIFVGIRRRVGVALSRNSSRNDTQTLRFISK